MMITLKLACLVIIFSIFSLDLHEIYDKIQTCCIDTAAMLFHCTPVPSSLMKQLESGSEHFHYFQC